jgi:N-acetylglucosamine-6-sulfatase
MDYSRRDFIRTLGTVAGLSVMPAESRNDQLASSNSKIRRNIVFIISDDHRFNFFSFLGKPKFLQTPNLDKLAFNGAHLRNAFVATSLCSPSRASILTGMYAQKHGVVDNDSPAPKDNIFFPTYLQQAGYRTAFIGKWHMGEHSDKPQPGFDRWVSFPGQGVYFDPVFNIDGERKQQKGYITDLLTQFATDWIAQQNSTTPFFLYLSHKAAHAEFMPAPRHAGKYRNSLIEYPQTMANKEENYRGKPRWVREQRSSWHGVDYMFHGQMDFDTFYRSYCETLLALDDSIGRILDALKNRGFLESTLILYTSDNGFSLGEHGLIDKRHMYEESIRIPLLAHCPEIIRPHTVVDPFIQNVDLAPTMLEAAGIDPPKTMQGGSFLLFLKGETIPWRDSVFYIYFWERAFPQTPTVFGIRTKRYKYMTYHGIWDIDELYDLENDPEETQNLIDHKEQKELIESLRTKVFDWLEKQNAMSIPLRRGTLWQAAERKLPARMLS